VSNRKSRSVIGVASDATGEPEAALDARGADAADADAGAEVALLPQAARASAKSAPVARLLSYIGRSSLAWCGEPMDAPSARRGS
jgi:hypothetical protein